MANRDEFLAEIRARLEARRVPPPDYHPPRAPDSVWLVQATPVPAADLLDSFVAASLALGVHTQVVPGAASITEYLLELTRLRQARTLVRWGDPLLDSTVADEALRAAGLEVTVLRADATSAPTRDVLAAADIGVTVADYALADTGSVVLSSGAGRPRAASLLPPTHVVLVPGNRILASLGALLEQLTPKLSMLPASLTLATGPSRSADIEQSLAIGVHGPGDVHVLVLDDILAMESSVQ